MRLILRLASQLLVCGAFLVSCSSSPAPGELLAPQIRALEQRADLIRDANDIKRLQRAYGFYWDKGMWNDVADLFTADATIQYGSEAALSGEARIRGYFRDLGHGRIGLAYGEMNNRIILQPVVHVSPDGLTAKARWRALIQSGQFKQSATWGEGTYEVQYRKEAAVWKISQLRWYPTFLAPYKGGWAHAKDPPSPAVAPFHYGNPVQERTGNPRSSAPVPPEIAAWELELRKIEAHDAVENLQAMYGYYIDRNLWDDAAQLLSQDATYETEQRGVYNGRKRIREALALKGPRGPQAGRLSIEMQLQPIVHVSDDGLRAKARWRTLEMKGIHGEAGQWGEGVYENEYRLKNGTWRISKLHYYLTFRADYDKGWTNGPLPIATASKELPPDAPPTEVYAALPDVHLPPYHYENPVAQAHPRPDAPGVSAPLQSLARKIERLNDEIDVQNLQRSYGYYVDKHMWDEVVQLFSPLRKRRFRRIAHPR